MTYFVVDMQAPGVEVRPLYQITGEAEFNEVYFTDVRIPDAERLGEVGEGWRVSLTTLMNERVSIGGRMPPQRRRAHRRWPSRRGTRRDRTDPRRRDELMALWVAGRGAAAHELAGRAAPAGRARPGPRARSARSAFAELNKEIMRVHRDLLGADGMLIAGGYPMTRPEHAPWCSTRPAGVPPGRANSIEGGTTEVMKNILGERVLGLPGDVRTDKELPGSRCPQLASPRPDCQCVQGGAESRWR